MSPMANTGMFVGKNPELPSDNMTVLNPPGSCTTNRQATHVPGAIGPPVAREYANASRGCAMT